MKRILAFFLLTALLLSACSQKTAQTPDTTGQAEVTAPGPTEEVPSPITDDVPIGQPMYRFEAQYLRTDGYDEAVIYPVVEVITHREMLLQYLESNREKYNFDVPPGGPLEDSISFFTFCDLRYDDAYFENKFLVMVLLQEPSGSNSHTVTALTGDGQGNLSVQINRNVPEVGTCDMAQWHILVEPETAAPLPEEVLVYLDGALAYNGHSHTLAPSIPQADTGVIHDTTVTFRISGEEYTFSGVYASGLSDILRDLPFNPHMVCRCLPEFTVETENGTYGIHLSQGYARCDDGQASLTAEQVSGIRHILTALQGHPNGLQKEEIIKSAILYMGDFQYDRVEAHYDINEICWIVDFYIGQVLTVQLQLNTQGAVVNTLYGR